MLHVAFLFYFFRLQGFKKKKYCIFSGDLAAGDGRGSVHKSAVYKSS